MDATALIRDLIGATGGPSGLPGGNPDWSKLLPGYTGGSYDTTSGRWVSDEERRQKLKNSMLSGSPAGLPGGSAMSAAPVAFPTGVGVPGAFPMPEYGATGSVRPRVDMPNFTPGQGLPGASAPSGPDPYDEYGKAIDASTEAQRKALGMLAGFKPQGTMPRPGTALWALVADLVFNHGHGDLFGGFLGGFDKRRSGENEEAYRKAGLESQDAMLGADSMRQKAQLGLDKAKYQDEKKFKDAQLEIQKTVAGTRQDAMDEKTRRDNALAYEGVYKLYTGAKTGQLVRSIGKRLQGLDATQAPSDEEIDAEAKQLDSANTHSAVRDWATTVSTTWKPNIFGEYSDSDLNAMKKSREQIAGSYGVREDLMPLPKTGKTFLYEREKVRREEWKKDFGLRTDIAANHYAHDQALMDLGKQRMSGVLAQIQIAAENADTQRYNALVGAYRAQHAAYATQAKALNGALDKDIAKAKAQAARWSKIAANSKDQKDKDGANALAAGATAQAASLATKKENTSSTPQLAPPDMTLPAAPGPSGAPNLSAPAVRTLPDASLIRSTYDAWTKGKAPGQKRKPTPREIAAFKANFKKNYGVAFDG